MSALFVQRFFGTATTLLVLVGCSSSGGAGDSDLGLDLAADLGAPYTITLFDNVRINSIDGMDNLRQAMADFAFDAGPYSRARLEVQLDTSCFPFETWNQNPPPAGQSWPADCDAFDRLFTFHMDPPKGQGDPPAFEWVRAITPFGGPMAFEVDLTDLANARPGKHVARVEISTNSDPAGKVSGSNGGWWVTAKINVEPGQPPRQVLAAIPLLDLVHSFDSGKQEVKVEVPPGTKGSVVEYRVTGHGGVQVQDSACVGPAEEFCQRWHHLFVDGKEEVKTAPWRADCDTLCTKATSGTLTYCEENPCGAVQSVEAPRANWCPGSVTPPLTWSFPALHQAGQHTFGYSIENVADGGKWWVSATYYAYGEPHALDAGSP